MDTTRGDVRQQESKERHTVSLRATGERAVEQTAKKEARFGLAHHRDLDTGAGFPHTDIQGAKGAEGVVAFLFSLHGPLRAELGRARRGVRRWLRTRATTPR